MKKRVVHFVPLGNSTLVVHAMCGKEIWNEFAARCTSSEKETTCESCLRALKRMESVESTAHWNWNPLNVPGEPQTWHRACGRPYDLKERGDREFWNVNCPDCIDAGLDRALKLRENARRETWTS